MRENRDAILAEILHTEAGYAERPEEGGGAVNRGVTFTVFQAWRGLKGDKDVTWKDLEAMTKEEAIAIYEAQFLTGIHFDELPNGVDYCVLDAAVNGGVAGSIKILQEALGFPEEKCDGAWGLVTRWAVTHRTLPELINRLCDERLETYRTFVGTWNKVANAKTGKTWGLIWSERIAKVRAHALKMVGAPTLPSGFVPIAAIEEFEAKQASAPKLTPIVPSPYINKLGMELLLEGWTREGFRNYVETVVSKKMSTWRPQGLVLHCTYQPTLKQWDEDKTVRKITEAQRIANMVPMWQRQGFKACPHLFIDREEIWTATPLWKRGTHAPSFNATYWGMELVGDYASKPGETLPAELRTNAVWAAACLFGMLGKEPTPTTLKFHGEDPRTTHKTCPGHGVGTKAQWDKDIEAMMATLYPGEHYVRD